MSNEFSINKNRVAIFGAYGLLGSFLSQYLEKKSYLIFRQGRQFYSDYKLDPNDSFMVKKFLDETNPDYVVNLNAITDVDYCEDNPSIATIGNVKTVETLVKNLNQKKSHLIHISTDQVYSGNGPHREDEVNPINFYGLTKYQAEIEAKKVNGTILRTNFLGKSFSQNKSSLTDWFVKSFVSNSFISLFTDIKISAVHQEFLSSIIERSFSIKPSKTINVGCKNFITKAELAIQLSKALNFDFKNYKLTSNKNISRSAPRPEDMSLDTLKFNNIFNQESPLIEETINLLKKDYEKIAA